MMREFSQLIVYFIKILEEKADLENVKIADSLTTTEPQVVQAKLLKP